jgi:hypothetical protein
MGARAAKPPLMIRLAGAGLLVLVSIISITLAAAPIAWLWLLSNLDLKASEFYVLMFLGGPVVVLGWGLLALQLNALYQQLMGIRTRVVLEASVTAGVVIAAAAVTYVFFAGSGGTHLGP